MKLRVCDQSLNIGKDFFVKIFSSSIMNEIGECAFMIMKLYLMRWKYFLEYFLFFFSNLDQWSLFARNVETKQDITQL